MSIHISTLVYLFAEQFSEPAKALVPGAIAPRTGNKINAKPLAVNLYVSAIYELVKAGAVQVETVEVKKLFGKEKVLALAFVKEPVEKISALALRILGSIQVAKNSDQRRVREVVIRVIGGRSSTYYPWLVALAPTMGEAEANGLITRPEKKPNVLKAMFNPTESLTGASAVTECVNPLEMHVDSARSQLAGFEQSLGADGPALRNEIEKGIDECTQRSSD